MSTDKQGTVNSNKRLLESPGDISRAKRPMAEVMHGLDETNPGGGYEPLTASSFRQILKIELNAALDQKLSTLATKEDIAEVQKDVGSLTTVQQNHETRLQQMEWRQRTRNVIFKYIPQKRNYKQYIISLIHNIMGLQHIHPRSIFTLKTLHDKKQAILLVEFMDNDEVNQIFSQVKSLKDTNIIIEKDLSPGERETKVVLLNIRKEILKRAKANNVSIKVIVSENCMKFDDDIFLFNKAKNEFYMGSVDDRLVLRDYLIDKFNILVDNNYSIISNV